MNWMRTAAIFFLKALESWTFVHTALADKETTRINAGLLRLRDSRTKNVTNETRATLGAEVERGDQRACRGSCQQQGAPCGERFERNDDKIDRPFYFSLISIQVTSSLSRRPYHHQRRPRPRPYQDRHQGLPSYWCGRGTRELARTRQACDPPCLR